MLTAIFGGSFNPVHVGHVLVCTWLLSTEQAQQVWVVPSLEHPFHKELAPYEDRMTMCEAAFSFLEGVTVSENLKSVI